MYVEHQCFIKSFELQGSVIFKFFSILLEPVISMSPEHISVIPNLSEIKYTSVLPFRPIFWNSYQPKFNLGEFWKHRNVFRTHWYNWLYFLYRFYLYVKQGWNRSSEKSIDLNQSLRNVFRAKICHHLFEVPDFSTITNLHQILYYRGCFYE